MCYRVRCKSGERLLKFYLQRPESVLADCCSAIGFALIQCKTCLNVFVEVVDAKSETLQNYAVIGTVVTSSNLPKLLRL